MIPFNRTTRNLFGLHMFLSLGRQSCSAAMGKVPVDTHPYLRYCFLLLFFYERQTSALLALVILQENVVQETPTVAGTNTMLVFNR